MDLKPLVTQLKALNRNWADHNRIERARSKREAAQQKELSVIYKKAVAMADKMLNPTPAWKLYGYKSEAAYLKALRSRRRSAPVMLHTVPGVQ